jgi:hypothetical protein
MEKLRLLRQKQQPPTGKPNPPKGGAPAVGGYPNAVDITDELSAGQRADIGDKVRECWTKDPGALDGDKMSVQITVLLDANGIVRDAKVGPNDVARMSDPRFRAFAERAARTPLAARCANLPVPKDRLGALTTLTFLFVP